jgi:anti-sigma B factor antagonist
MMNRQEAPMGATSRFSSSSERHGDCVTVELVGDVDVLQVAAIRRLLGDALIDGCRLLVVDLAGVTFMDSVGLGVLVATWKRARVLRVEMVVWRPSPPVATVLSLTALDRVLRVDLRDDHPGVDEQQTAAG